jgi:hypothetical protein
LLRADPVDVGRERGEPAVVVLKVHGLVPHHAVLELWGRPS